MPEILSYIGDTKTCAQALIIKNNRILLGHRHYEEISIWTCPWGRSDYKETLETTLRRETAEEVGINDLEINEYLGEFLGSHKGDVVHAFLCNSNQEVTLMEPDKFSEWKWFNKDEVKNLLMSENTRELIQALL